MTPFPFEMKTEKKFLTLKEIKKQLRDEVESGMTVKALAQKYGIPLTTFRDFLYDEKCDLSDSFASRLSLMKVFMDRAK